MPVLQASRTPTVTDYHRDAQPSPLLLRMPHRGGTEPSRYSNAPPPDAQPDLHEELITLAHEYGHFRSSAEYTERAEYELYVASAKKRDDLAKKAWASMPKDLTKQQCNDRVGDRSQGAR